MELQLYNEDTAVIAKKEYQHKPFIEANTQEVSIAHLKNDCIVPVFSKDCERTISHSDFIEITQFCVSKLFPNQRIDTPELRVSHPLKGRVAEAVNKQVNELLDHEKTLYYERMAFIVRIPSITETINGNELALTIGGVRSYNQENLYNKKSMEKFKFFIGFQNKVCCNLCVSSDGFVEEMRVGSLEEMSTKIVQVIQNYNMEKHIYEMQDLTSKALTEQQFAQLLGKTRLYQHLPKIEKTLIPELNYNDGQFSSIARDYYLDNSFCRDESGDINLWNVYNLFTSANKSSYIDNFLTRQVNAFEFTNGIKSALEQDSPYSWFIN
ncbi:MAG: DUF3871 family protein [Chitinophagales bacterium]|nr:DUF3871 family protein [Chitinophagales bacterium]